ncbi:TonB-dependent receptor [Lysobacter fragariae]
MQTNHRNGLHLDRLSVALATALLFNNAAFAQQSPASPPDPAQPATPQDAASQDGTSENAGTKKATDLDTVLVTARKRSENILKVPMSISAVSATEIKERNLSSVTDLYRTIASGANATGELILRGLAGSNSGAPGTTNQFVDGVPLSAGLFSDLADVERVEVLRGPQGTLWGSNAIGGTVQIVTRRPQTDSFEMFTTLRATETNNVEGTALRGDAGLNIPLIKGKLAARVTASVYDTPLAIVNAATGTQSNREGKFLRTQLQWEPTDDMHVNFSHFYIYSHDVGTNRADRSIPEYRTFASATPNVDSPWGYDVSYTDVTCRPGAERAECYSGGNPRGHADPVYSIYESLDDWDNDRTNLYSLSFDHDNLWGFASLHYVGSYRTSAHSGLDNWSRLDMDDLIHAWIINKDSEKRVTHELRLQNNETHAGFDWTLGVFQDRTWSNPEPDLQWEYEDSDPASMAIFSDWNDWAWEDWEPYGVHNVTEMSQYLWGRPNANYRNILYYSKQNELAGFGELTYHLDTGIGAFEFTGGLRHFRLEDAYSGREEGIWIGPEPLDTQSAGSESGNRKKLSVSYQPNQNLNLYALYSEGYRPGGNNFPSLPHDCEEDTYAGAFKPRYNSDQIDNYELGLKTAAFDNRLRLAAAAYRINWSGVQAEIYMPSCGFSYTANAAKARSEGVEVESTLGLGERSQLTFNASYTDSKMLSDVDSIGAHKGDGMANIPHYNAYIAFDQGFTLFNREAFLRADVNAYGSYKSHFITSDDDMVDAYHTLNLSGRIRVNENSEFSIHWDNVLNKRYATYRSARSRDVDADGNVIIDTRAPLYEIYGPESSVTLRWEYSFY